MPGDFAAADVAVLPYTAVENNPSFLNSGAALLGLSFDKPLLAPAMGSLVELRQTLGDSWVRTYDGDLTPALLHEALDWLATRPMSRSAPLAPFDWRTIAERTVAAYAALLGGSGPAR